MDALLTKLSAFAALTNEEVAALDSLQGPHVALPAGRELIYQGQRERAAYILRSGWICSHKRLPDGARQIIDIQLPGDFVGLRGVLLTRSDQTFETLTDVQVSNIRTSRLQSVLGEHPGLARALLLVDSRMEAMRVERLVSISRRDAMQRTCHFLLELWARMRWVGQAAQDGFECPLSQSVLADVVGITSIHLNRVLRQLREADLLRFRAGNVTFLDRKRLAEIATFDFSYLEVGTATHALG